MIITGNIHHRKVLVSCIEVANFNSLWPCSELKSTQSYWFEFDHKEDLVDTNVTEQDDGSAATAMSHDCQRALFDGIEPVWSQGLEFK